MSSKKRSNVNRESKGLSKPGGFSFSFIVLDRHLSSIVLFWWLPMDIQNCPQTVWPYPCRDCVRLLQRVYLETACWHRRIRWVIIASVSRVACSTESVLPCIDMLIRLCDFHCCQIRGASTYIPHKQNGDVHQRYKSTAFNIWRQKKKKKCLKGSIFVHRMVYQYFSGFFFFC